MAVADLIYNLVGHDKGASRAFKSVGDSSEHANKRLDKFKGLAGGVATAAAAVGVGAIAVGKQLFDTAVSVEALGNKARVVFGRDFGKASKAAGKLAGDLGMTQTQVVGLLAGFGDLLTPMGFTTSQAEGMSERLGTLTAALTQWSGGTKTSADVADILSDALTGEYDSLKSLGVQIDADLIKQKLHAQGKDKLTGAALKQAQAEIALKEITAQSSNALNGYNSRTNKLALAKQRLTSQIGSAKEALATKLLPVFVTATTWISSKFVPGVQKLIGEFRTKFGPTLEKIGGDLRTKVLPVFQKVFSNPDVQQGLKKLGALVGLAAIAIAGMTAASLALSAAFIAAIGWITNKLGPSIRGLAAIVLDAAGIIIGSLAKAFGPIPGIGDKLKGAAKDFEKFKNDVNRSLGNLQDQTINIRLNSQGAVYGKSGRGHYEGSTFVPDKRAMGGPVRAGRSYLVGEQGPEVVTFGASGFVTPNNRIGGAVGGTHVHFHGFVGSPAQVRAQLADVTKRGAASGNRAKFA